MPKLSSREASICAIVVFLSTLVLGFLFPAYGIAFSGLLIVVFLSVFIEGPSSTIIAGAISGLAVAGFIAWQILYFDSYTTAIGLLFIILLLFFCTLLVLYIKQLIQKEQLDKSHMTSLFQNATEGIVLTNGQGHIVLINPAACAMFGYYSEELTGKEIEVLIPRSYRKGHVSMRNGFYKHPQNREMGAGRDLRGERKNGDAFPVEVSLSHYSRGEQRFIIAFVVDITLRKETEHSMKDQQMQLAKVSDDLRKLNTELEGKVEERTLILKKALQRLELSQTELSEALDKERQLNEIKSRFVSMASHEFRTPLSTVLSSASLLNKYTTTEQQEARNKHINRIKDSVKHLNNLLEDFLSLGKLDEGKIGATFSLLNLPGLINETMEEMKVVLKKDQYTICHHEGEEKIISDRNLIKNMLINLISNAGKFSGEGAPIKIDSSLRNGTVTIAVADEGIGISAEDQQHLFSSFFRGKNALNIEGTGLGLHIVKRYLELLGGHVSLQSKLGQGTTITVSLPNQQSYATDHISN